MKASLKDKIHWFGVWYFVVVELIKKKNNNQVGIYFFIAKIVFGFCVALMFCLLTLDHDIRGLSSKRGLVIGIEKEERALCYVDR